MAETPEWRTVDRVASYIMAMVVTLLGAACFTEGMQGELLWMFFAVCLFALAVPLWRETFWRGDE